MSKAAAIFDLDKTLLVESSGKLIAQYLMHTGQVTHFFRRRDLASLGGALILYKLGVLNVDQIMARTAKIATDIRLDEMWSLVDMWFQEVVADKITEQAKQRLEWHRNLGHKLIICSAASQFSVEPVARYLDIPHTIYTSWLEKAGRLTGEVQQPIAYGAGKVFWINKWAQQHNVDLAQSYFYTDHISDRPLLELVAHPIAVNPDRKLLKIAQTNQWPVLEWNS